MKRVDIIFRLDLQKQSAAELNIDFGFGRRGRARALVISRFLV